MSWQNEHGASYAVPAEITSALADQSWHNDACPSFASAALDGTEHDLRLWVEHPDPERRETSSPTRYAVNYQAWNDEPVPALVISEYGDLYAGDDAAAALAAYATAERLILAEIERKS